MKLIKKFWVELLLLFLMACGGSGSTLFAAHSVTLTWTPPTSMATGSYINIYRGSVAGQEGAAPINSTGIATTIMTFTDSSVSANTTYFYTAKQCVLDQTKQEVCSGPSNEASATVPLASGDLTAPAALGAVAK
jgi:hypothetical protein